MVLPIPPSFEYIFSISYFRRNICNLNWSSDMSDVGTLIRRNPNRKFCERNFDRNIHLIVFYNLWKFKINSSQIKISTTFFHTNSKTTRRYFGHRRVATLTGFQMTGESQSTVELFLKSNNSRKTQKNLNSPGTSLTRPDWADWGKKRVQKISWDCPFKEPL